jgi:hypothetical protein
MSEKSNEQLSVEQKQEQELIQSVQLLANQPDIDSQKAEALPLLAKHFVENTDKMNPKPTFDLMKQLIDPSNPKSNTVLQEVFDQMQSKQVVGFTKLLDNPNTPPKNRSAIISFMNTEFNKFFKVAEMNKDINKKTTENTDINDK